MSVVIEFTDNLLGEPIKVTVPYNHGDYEYSVLNISCVVIARNYANKMIAILEKQRLSGALK